MKISEAKGNEQSDLLEEYIKFCVLKINEFFVEVKLAKQEKSWDIEARPRSALLSPTAINGLIICLRKIIEGGHELNSDSHKKKLKDVDQMQFESFKSSQWQKLGSSLYTAHYA